MQLYYQNPRFGFHIIRLITGRLIENLRRVEPIPAGCRPRPRPGAAGGRADHGRRAARPQLAGELRAGFGAVGCSVSAPAVPWRLIILLAVGWQLGPYLRSTVSRDSAVTSWIHVATSPIAGNLDSRLPKPGDRVGSDGVIVTIRNRHSDPSAAERSAGEVDARRGRRRGAAAVCRRHAPARRRVAGHGQLARGGLQGEPRSDPDLGAARAGATQAAAGDRAGRRSTARSVLRSAAMRVCRPPTRRRLW